MVVENHIIKPEDTFFDRAFERLMLSISIDFFYHQPLDMNFIYTLPTNKKISNKK